MRRLVRGKTLMALCVLAVSLVSARRAHAALGDCSQPVTDGSAPVATDCLYILNVAVGAETCSPVCMCAPRGALPTVAADALACLIVATAGRFVLDCPCGKTTTLTRPTSTTTSPAITSTTLAVAVGCPDTLEVTSFARTGAACDDDTDCPVGSCDLALTRCTTVTEFDLGWTGIGHDRDTNHDEGMLAHLSCGEIAPCGVCEIDGVDPASRACRCADDNRLICDEPFAVDQDDCDGAMCVCYLGAPLPLSSGNTPSCIVTQLATDLAGTIDVDAGELALTLDLRAKHYLGSGIVEPCPSCAGDAAPVDGVRDGTCVDGENDGLSCDVDAINTTFPAPGGANYSLDCFPDAGKNVSGAGLIERMTLTTAVSSLGSNVQCPMFTIPGECPCGVCQRECAVNDDCTGLNLTPNCMNGTCAPKSGVPCSSDTECVDAGYTSCVSRGSGDPRPRQCAGAGGCTMGPDGDAVCDEGPLDQFCDGVLRADGGGLLPCQSDLDCAADTIGIDAGSCALTQARECFLPTIEASGSPDPDTPIGATIFCVPPASGAGYNSVFGIIGPARLVRQMRTRKLCGGADGMAYVANGGCPAPPAAAAAPASE